MRGPSWVTATPTGWVATVQRSRRDLGWSIAITVLAVFWTVIVGYGLLADGPDGTVLCMAAMGVFLWFITAVAVHSYGQRVELELATTEVRVRTWQFGRPRPQVVLPLDGLTVEPYEHDGNKGYTVVGVVLTSGDATARVNLPGGLNIAEREAVKAGLHWVVDELRRATPRTSD